MTGNDAARGMAADSDRPDSSGAMPVLFFLAALLAVWGLVQDILNTYHGGSTDLRNRITGARLAVEARDPYFYSWTDGESDRLLDVFNSPASPVSHTTITPPFLVSFIPFNPLPYRVTQWLWFLMEYGFLIGGFAAWAAGRRDGLVLHGAVLALLFCATPHWRMHMDRGQSYVLYAGMLLAAARFGRTRPALEALGCVALFAVRPNFGALLGVPVARRNRSALIAAAAGLLAAVIVPMLIAGPDVWRNYFRAMSVHSDIYLHHQRFAPSRIALDSIEGIPIDVISKFARIPFADTSVYRLFSFTLPPSLLLGTWVVLAAGAGWLLVRRGETGSGRFWWAASAWILLGDFLLPAARYSYNHILLVPLLLFGLGALEGAARRWWTGLSLALLAVHLATWAVLFSTSHLRWMLTIPGYATFFFSVLAAVWSLVPARPARVADG